MAINKIRLESIFRAAGGAFFLQMLGRNLDDIGFRCCPACRPVLSWTSQWASLAALVDASNNAWVTYRPVTTRVHSSTYSLHWTKPLKDGGHGIGVGERIRAFLEDEEVLISAIATGNILARISVNGVSVTDALYRFGRTSIAHEGELDPRLQFNDTGAVEIGTERWNLPSGYIVGMSMAVIVAPENRVERMSSQLAFTLFGRELRVNDIWGQRDMVREIICEKFQNPRLFEWSWCPTRHPLASRLTSFCIACQWL